MTQLTAPITMAPNFLATVPKTKKGIQISIPITVKQCTGIQAFTLVLEHLKSVMVFKKIVPSLTFIEALNAGEPITTTDLIKTIIVWSDPVNMLNLPANKVLFKLVYQYYGGMTELNWITSNYPGADGHMQSGCEYAGIVNGVPGALPADPPENYFINGLITS
jgi:hypothetical protein